MTLGLFGGTFDPPHIGHLIVAQDAAETLALDRIVFVPAGRPPHKAGEVITPALIRLEMTRLATADMPGFEVDDREVRRVGPSWTVDTLAAIHAERPGEDLVLLVGADQYGVFETWKDVARLRSLCRIAVLDREGGAGPVEAGDVRVRVTRLDISASDVRDRVAAGRSIRHLVPASVEALIRERGLYADRSATAENGTLHRNEIAGAG